jgi:3-oxoacyl-[acyl-carrier-protein] synthase III
MRFESVAVTAVAHVLPEERVTSAALEERLAGVYDRLRLRAGRLELMSGIRERRFWPRGTPPSSGAIEAGERALEASGIARERIGCLVYAAVSRDYLEPATAALVHDGLGLPDACHLFDLSNACLGCLNALVLVGGMIERGEIEAGLVVASEDARPLVERTIAALDATPAPDKAELKRAFASLTIGSGAAAVVLERADPARAQDRLLGGAVLAATRHHRLCRGDVADGEGLWMATDSEALLHAGNELALRTFERFQAELGWTRDAVDRVVTHQVGVAHRRLLFETLGLDPARDFPTVELLGNVGSVSLPLSWSMARDAGFLRPGERLALLGIGSGLNCLMLGVRTAS